MDRREFFTRGAGKAAQALTKYAVDKARKDSIKWIRPPFAIEELDFLLACNRCGDCLDACPHNIIFSLRSNLGANVFATPAINLRYQACHLCEDWPCVQVCNTDALALPKLTNEQTNASENIKHTTDELPLIAIVSINTDLCLPYNGPECGACRVCPIDNAMQWEMEKPTISLQNCVGCGLCREACIIEPKAINVRSKYDV